MIQNDWQSTTDGICVKCGGRLLNDHVCREDGINTLMQKLKDIDIKMPSRMKDVDPVVRNMMMGPHCLIS